MQGMRPSLYGADGKATPEDMKQGGLGDCYFISACAAVAEF
jgi:Calpain family cysteine protease